MPEDCIVCYNPVQEPKNYFDCGRWKHNICLECSSKLKMCPLCKSPSKSLIQEKILIDAIIVGDLWLVKELLADGANVNVDEMHKNPLISACKHGHLEIVKVLLEAGADIHIGEGSPLRWACGFGHLEIVKLLLENGAQTSNTAYWILYNSVCDCKLEIVKALLSSGVVWDEYLMGKALKNKNFEIVQALLDGCKRKMGLLNKLRYWYLKKRCHDGNFYINTLYE